MRTAKQWGGDEIASRVRFSEVAKKEEHIIRCRVADIFLDTVEVSQYNSPTMIFFLFYIFCTVQRAYSCQ